MVKLGNKVRDTISGLIGIATGRSEYLYGCASICITPQGLHDGNPIESRWVDEQRVEVVEERAVEISASSSATSGGPQNEAPTRSATTDRRTP